MILEILDCALSLSETGVFITGHFSITSSPPISLPDGNREAPSAGEVMSTCLNEDALAAKFDIDEVGSMVDENFLVTFGGLIALFKVGDTVIW